MARRHDDWDDDDDDPRPRRRSIVKQSTFPWLWVGVAGAIAAAAVAVIIIVANKSSGGKEEKDDTPQFDLIAHWTFNNVANGMVIDQSPRKNNAVLRGGRLAAGRSGQAFWLDGRPNEFCDLGTSSDLNFSANSSFTFMGWINTNIQDGTVLSLRNTQKNTQIDFVIRGGFSMVVIGDDADPGTENGFIGGRPVNDGQWHHWAFTRRGSSVELYVDGISQGTGTGHRVSGPITTDLRAIGSERLWLALNDMRWGNPHFKGGIDEVRVYNRALSADEIKDVMNKP